jgi:hypothetical protein
MEFDYYFNPSGVLDLVEIAKAPSPDFPKDLTQGAKVKGEEGFFGTETYEEAVELVERGWSDAEKLKEASTQLALDLNQSVEVSTVHSVSGSMVDVGAFVSGEPECMIDFRETEAQKLVSIGCNMAAASRVEFREFLMRGAMVVTLSDALQKAGYSVEIVIYAPTSTKLNGEGNTSLLTVPVKRADEYLDPDQIAFWFCHPSAFRRHVLAFYESQSPDVVRAMDFHNHGCYGFPMPDWKSPDYDFSIAGFPTSMDDAGRKLEAMIRDFQES